MTGREKNKGRTRAQCEKTTTVARHAAHRTHGFCVACVYIVITNDPILYLLLNIKKKKKKYLVKKLNKYNPTFVTERG